MFTSWKKWKMSRFKVMSSAVGWRKNCKIIPKIGKIN